MLCNHGWEKQQTQRPKGSGPKRVKQAKKLTKRNPAMGQKDHFKRYTLKNLKQFLKLIKITQNTISVCFANNLIKTCHLKTGFNVLNVCSGFTIGVWIMLAKDFSVQFLSCLIFLTLPCMNKKVFLFDFFSFQEAEVLILILEIQNKIKNYF